MTTFEILSDLPRYADDIIDECYHSMIGKPMENKYITTLVRAARKLLRRYYKDIVLNVEIQENYMTLRFVFFGGTVDYNIPYRTLTFYTFDEMLRAIENIMQQRVSLYDFYLLHHKPEDERCVY